MRTLIAAGRGVGDDDGDDDGEDVEHEAPASESERYWYRLGGVEALLGSPTGLRGVYALRGSPIPRDS